MPIPFQCPRCGAKINAPDKAAGKQVTCPKGDCGQVMIVPSLASRHTESPAPDNLDFPPSSEAGMRPRNTGAGNRPSKMVWWIAGGVGGLLLIIVLIIAFSTSGSSGGSGRARVYVTVRWQTPEGVKTDTDPAVVLIPKGTNRKIDALVPIYLGTDTLTGGDIKAMDKYRPLMEIGDNPANLATKEKYFVTFDWQRYLDRYKDEYEAAGAYVETLSTEGQVILDPAEQGSYIVIVFANGRFIKNTAEEERTARQLLANYFEPSQIDPVLMNLKVKAREIEIDDSIVELEIAFP